MTKTRRVRGWPVVVAPIIVASACSIPLTVATFTSTFESRFLDVPSTETVELEAGQSYSLTRPAMPFEDEQARTRVTVRDSDGDELRLEHSLNKLAGEVGRINPKHDGDYRIRVRGTSSDDDASTVILQRRPFAMSTRPAQVNLAGSIAALVLFVFMYRRWKRQSIEDA